MGRCIFGQWCYFYTTENGFEAEKGVIGTWVATPDTPELVNSRPAVSAHMISNGFQGPTRLLLRTAESTFILSQDEPN
ncbi:hypothetical protein A9Q96_10290 [Rhodobacterales bacterium 52_120_T64]|nr:hypothetical protein A9Q96_10290 [Rhodobacterales bacterium 52_120_T64]